MAKSLQTEFILKDREVTEERYDEMLGVLPPERMTGNAFLVGEAVDYGKDLSGKFLPRYELYFMVCDKYYYGGLASTEDFDAFVIAQ